MQGRCPFGLAPVRACRPAASSGPRAIHRALPPAGAIHRSPPPSCPAPRVGCANAGTMPVRARPCACPSPGGVLWSASHPPSPSAGQSHPPEPSAVLPRSPPRPFAHVCQSPLGGCRPTARVCRSAFAARRPPRACQRPPPHLQRARACRRPCMPRRRSSTAAGISRCRGGTNSAQTRVPYRCSTECLNWLPPVYMAQTPSRCSTKCLFHSRLRCTGLGRSTGARQNASTRRSLCVRQNAPKAHRHLHLLLPAHTRREALPWLPLHIRVRRRTPGVPSLGVRHMLEEMPQTQI